MPGSVMNYTAAGWPYLDEDSHLEILDEYTVELADKLQNSDADVAAAINAAAEATAARDEIETRVAQLPLRMSAGSVTVPSAAATSTSIVVNFPVGRFSATPIVVVSVASQPGGSGMYVARVTQRNANNCTIALYASTGNITVACLCTWVAVQMLPGS